MSAEETLKRLIWVVDVLQPQTAMSTWTLESIRSWSIASSTAFIWVLASWRRVKPPDTTVSIDPDVSRAKKNIWRCLKFEATLISAFG